MKLQSAITLLAKILIITIILVASQLSPVRAVEQSPSTVASNAASNAASPKLQATPTPVIFGEFDTATNGFGFQNYGSSFPEGDLTIAEVQELFGDQVCHRLDGTTCVPSADAQLWTDTMNQYMAGGHCNGFTVMSRRLFDGQFAAEEFTSEAESAFHIERSAPIMRRIAQNWAQQVTDEILNAEFWGTPQEVIDALQETTELVELKLYYGSLGHSMLAFGLQDMGDGIYHILVYDNNWPGRTDLYVEVDYDADSWQYSLAALNPNEASDVWTGDGKSTYPSLVFVALSAYDQKLTCPFCTSGESAPAKTTNINLTGAGDFLVRDDQGRYSGIWAGATIGNIPDSQVRRFVGAPSTKAAQVSLPLEEDITVQIGNTTLAQDEPGDLRIGSPGFSAALDDLMLSQNCTEEVAFSHTTQTIGYAAHGVQEPVIKLAVQDDEGADFLFVLAGAEFQPGQDLKLHIDPDNGLILTSDTLDADNVTLVMARLGATGESVFASDGLIISGGGVIALDYANWNGLAPLDIQVDADGDGVFEQTAALDNSFPQTPVVGSTSGDELITILNEVAPYMDQTDKEAFLDEVSASPLDGDDVGRLFLALDGLAISDDDLTAFVAETDLPPEELVEVIHEVRRDEDSRTALLDRLPLSGDEKAAIQDELQALDEVRKVLVDLDFQDPAPHEQVEALLPYIFDRGLNPRQIGNLIERLAANGNLSDTETEELLADLNLPLDMEAQIRDDLPGPGTGEVTAEPATAAETGDTTAEPTAAPADAAAAEKAPASTPEPEPTATPTPTLAQTPAPEPTPTAAQAPSTATNPLSFEPFGSWRRGDQAYATLTSSNECVQDGTLAAQMSYDFSAATAADDFVVFTQRIAVLGNPNMVHAWVHGDGSGHLFNIWIEDANGEVWSAPMGAVTHSGWQQMTGAINVNAPWPGGRVYGPDNGAIDYPIRFLGLVIDRTDGSATGTLCFDNITFGAGDSSSARTEVPAPSAPPAASGSCTNIPISTGSDVMVRFVNESGSVAIGYWMDADNQLQEYYRIDPGGIYDQETYDTHQWVVKDPSGVVLFEYTASDAQTQCVQITLEGTQGRVGEDDDGPASAGGSSDAPAPTALEYAGYIFSWSWTGYPLMSAVDDWYFDVKIFDNETAPYPYDVKVAEVDQVRSEGDQWHYNKKDDFKCGSYWAVQIAARNPDGSYAGPMSVESNRLPTGADCPPEALPGSDGDASGGDDSGGDDGGCFGDDC